MPFNRLRNQVAFNVVPSAATDHRAILKPPESVAQSALLVAVTLCEAGLPSLSVRW